MLVLYHIHTLAQQNDYILSSNIFKCVHVCIFHDMFVFFVGDWLMFLLSFVFISRLVVYIYIACVQGISILVYVKIYLQGIFVFVCMMLFYVCHLLTSFYFINVFTLFLGALLMNNNVFLGSFTLLMLMKIDVTKCRCFVCTIYS